MSLGKMIVVMIMPMVFFSCSNQLPKTEMDPLADGLVGRYIIVDARSASDVATTAGPAMDPGMPIGKAVTFQSTGFAMETRNCQDGAFESVVRGSIPIESDPNLIDLQLGPSDSPASAGDQRVAAHFNVTCAGRFFSRLSQVDDRVAVMSWANSAINLILEKPLSADQIKRYQTQLKSMKFYDGQISGELDTQTLAASRDWFKYRAKADDSTPIPARPAITVNLLDTLGVIGPETRP